MNSDEDIKPKMFRDANAEIFRRAKKLRRNETPAEKYLWEFLNKKQLLGVKFRRQHPIGNYIVDFYCHEIKVVVELDGAIHELDYVKDDDHEKMNYLKENNILVVQFANSEVLEDIFSVLEKLKNIITSRN